MKWYLLHDYLPVLVFVGALDPRYFYRFLNNRARPALPFFAMNGCFVGALIARTTDKVPLCAFTDTSYQQQSSNGSHHNSIRQQEQRILERLKPPTNASGDIVGSQYQSFDNKDVVFFVFIDAATNLTLMVAVNKLMLRNGGDTNSTNHLACTVLENIFSEFTATYSPEQINSTATRAYGFIKFDTTLQKIIARVVQQDKKTGGTLASGNRSSAAGNSSNYDSLKQELKDVHVVIRQNLEDLLTRGEKLETMNNYSAHLKDQSNKYYKRTVHMNRMRILKTYGPPIVVIVLLMLFFAWYFFW